MKAKGLRLKLSVLAMAIATSLATAFPVAAQAAEFTDVEGHWAEKAGIVDEVSERGLIKGIDNGDGTMSFQPDGKITRAQVAVILWRYYEPNADDGTYERNYTSWTDVKSRLWYTEAMNWAYKNEIYKGSGWKVRPNDPITRQELAVLLDRCDQKSPYYDPGTSGNVDDYIDGHKVSPWAVSSVSWAVDHEIMGSTAYLNPLGNATRAEASKMILGFIGNREIWCPTPGELMCYLFCGYEEPINEFQGYLHGFDIPIPYHSSIQTEGMNTNTVSASFDYDYDGEIDEYYICGLIGNATTLGKPGSMLSDDPDEVQATEDYLIRQALNYSEISTPSTATYLEYTCIGDKTDGNCIEAAIVQVPYESGMYLETAVVTTPSGDLLIYHAFESGLPSDSYAHYLNGIIYGGDPYV